MTGGTGKILVGVITALALLVAVPSANGFTPQQRANLQQLAELEASQSGYPGLLLGVWQRGQGSFATSVGVADLQTNRPFRTRDVFRVGSVTKTFTATAVLQLLEREQLRLRDRVDKLLPGFDIDPAITVRQLLNHTSGIPDLSNGLTEVIFLQPHTRWSNRAVIRNSLRQPPTCAPGSCWSYSNTNYLLLGLIAERVSHKPMRWLLRNGVIEPLRLGATSFAPSKPIPPPVAHGYVQGAPPANAPVDTSRWSFSWAWSAGGLNSTFKDLRRYSPALATGRGLLEKATQRKRLDFVDISNQVGVPGTGYGLGILTLKGYLGHDGVVPGYDSVILSSPSQQATIIAMGTTSIELDPVRDTQTAPSLLFNLAPAVMGVLNAP